MTDTPQPVRPMCQRRCIDDLCHGSQTLCGQEFCEHCGKPCIFDESVCDACREARGEAELEEEAHCI